MELCLGTVQLGMRYGIQNNGRPDRKEIDAILSAALENGICWFDTAPVYGEAESILGRYISEHPERAEHMRIISKLAANAFFGIPRKDWSRAVLEHIQTTLERLHKQCIAVYMFHNAAHIFDADAVKALETARQEGLAERIGVSIYTPEEAMRALAYPQISVIQIPYNVFDRRLDRCGFFAEAKKKNVRIYARSTLLQGLLTMTPEQLPVHMKFAAPYVEKFHSICIRGSISPLRAAVGFVKSHQDIHYLVFGSDNEKQLHEYLSIAAETLSPKVVNELNNEFDVVEERLVNPSLWNG